MDDARLDRNRLALEAIRVSRAVPSLVRGADDRTERSEEWHRGEDALADHRVLAHDGEFFRRERPRFLEDVARDADLADVMEEGAVFQQTKLLALQPEPLANIDGQLSGFPGVRLRVPVFRVKGGRQRPDGRHVALFLLPASRLVLVEQGSADAGRD